MWNLKARLSAARGAWRYCQAGGIVPCRLQECLDAALRWLCAAQDATNSGGFARAYSLRAGWDLPYPETTGYIIPTFLTCDKRFPCLGLKERAWRAGYWLADVQFASGAICSKQHRPGNTKPSVFNTGMVLHGWVSLLEAREDARIREAAIKAVCWLLSEQEPDGTWVKNAYNGIAHSYYTMVDWALLRYWALAKDCEARSAAVRNLDWVVCNQGKNGWIGQCGFNIGEAVTTHTLSYTTQGLVESGRLLGESSYIESAERNTLPLRRRFESSGLLPGTFDENWQPTAQWECCTGNAQTALVWQVLTETTGNKDWRAAAENLTRQLPRFQKIGARSPGISGGFPGSWPIGGGYDTCAFPNHAAKFAIDALAGLSSGTYTGFHPDAKL